MNNQTIVCFIVALLLGMLLLHMLKGVCGCKVVEGQGQQIGSEMCGMMLDQFADFSTNHPDTRYDVINSVDPFQFGAQGVTITPIFNPQGVRTPGDNIGCELNSKIFVSNADENHPWMKNVCSDYCGVPPPVPGATARAVCVNMYDTSQGVGACQALIGDNDRTSMCEAYFAPGGQYAGYCDMMCGYGVCPSVGN